MTQKGLPTFLLVHGPWLGGWAWLQVTEHLRKQGYTVYTPDLPGHGKEESLECITLQSYVEEVFRIMDLEEWPVILIGHSFAGVIISQVAEQHPDKVSGLVYLCAYLLPNQASFLEAGKGIHGSQILNHMQRSEDGKTVTIKDEYWHTALAHDLAAPIFESLKPNLVPEPVIPLATPLAISNERWGPIPRFYIECSEDRAIPVKAQQAMHQILGVQQVFSLQSSHLPMFSCPLKLSKLLMTISQSVTTHY